jgi:glutaredoxin
MNAQVLGISVDSKPCLVAWAKNLGGINYPLLPDFWPHGAVAKQYGVLQDDGRSERAIFIIDREGIIQYIDIHDIDEQPSNEVLFAELERIDPVAAKDLEKLEKSGTSDDLPSGGVVMYCTSWCSDCRNARVWLKANNIDFTEVDVTTNRKASEWVRQQAEGYLVTPTFDIDGTVVVDYDKEKLSSILKI